MKLKPQLIKKFVKATSDIVQPKKESIVYGTIVSYDKATKTAHVKLDGATTTIPITHYTTTVKTDERVIVMIKNHTAIITGSGQVSDKGVQYVEDKTYIEKGVESGQSGVQNYGTITFETDGPNVVPVFKYKDNASAEQPTVTKKILLEGDAAGGGGTVDITTVDLDKVRALWPDCNY